MCNEYTCYIVNVEQIPAMVKIQLRQGNPYVICYSDLRQDTLCDISGVVLINSKQDESQYIPRLRHE